MSAAKVQRTTTGHSDFSVIANVVLVVISIILSRPFSWIIKIFSLTKHLCSDNMDDRAVKQRVYRLVGVTASYPIWRNFRLSVESNPSFASSRSVIGSENSRSPRNWSDATLNPIATRTLACFHDFCSFAWFYFEFVSVLWDNFLSSDWPMY